MEAGAPPLTRTTLPPPSPPAPAFPPTQVQWEVRLLFLYTRGGATGDTVTVEDAARSAHAQRQRTVWGIGWEREVAGAGDDGSVAS